MWVGVTWRSASPVQAGPGWLEAQGEGSGWDRGGTGKGVRVGWGAQAEGLGWNRGDLGSCRSLASAGKGASEAVLDEGTLSRDLEDK